MPYYLVQGGTKLYRVETDGTKTELTLPTGVSLSGDVPARFAILNGQIVMFNSPSENLWIDRLNNVRRMTVQPPTLAPILAQGAAGVLTGAYRGKVTFIVRDETTGDLVAESDFSPVSDESPTLASKQLDISNIATSADHITGRRFYRTASGPGEDYFSDFEIDGNVVTTASDNNADAALAIAAAPTDLGAPPRRSTLGVVWKDRLWMVDALSPDRVKFSGNRKFYGFPVANDIPIEPVNVDTRGVTGFIARRDELAIGKRDIIWKIINDPPDISKIQLVRGVGIEAPDSCLVIRDIGYWLGSDGVYTWGPDGVQCISDAGNVRAWFKTDTYFNRAWFQYACARYNEKFHLYELHLASEGSEDLDVWVTYDIASGKWLGPHRTDAYDPTCCNVIRDADGLEIPVVGTEQGYLLLANQDGFSDGGAAAIDLDVVILEDTEQPDVEKYFGELSVLTQKEAAGTLSIIPALGAVDATDQAAISADLTRGRQRLRRMSTSGQPVGRLLRLNFLNEDDDQNTVLYGYEIPDWFVAGRR